MSHVIYSKEDILYKTPSIRDGIDYETECKFRKEGARFIIDIGQNMNLGCHTVATGVVYFHRFYMVQSFKTFPQYVTACCCIFLAGKVEETPKKCRDIIKTAKSLLDEENFVAFGLNPHEEVMTLERILLQTIKFNLKVQHPYPYLKEYIKILKGSKKKQQKIVQMAWNFVNDSLTTTLCLQWEPEIMAIAVIFLSLKMHNFTVKEWAEKLPHHTKWWDVFVEDLTINIVEDIAHQVLDIYPPGFKFIID